MTWYKFHLRCIDGGHGWGATGDEAEMCAESNMPLRSAAVSEASEWVRRQIPGGWVANYVGVTTDTFYLKHLSKEQKEDGKKDNCSVPTEPPSVGVG